MNKDDDLRFEDLYRRYYRSVCSFFSRRGFAPEDARDLAQTTFLRVYKGWEGYRGDAEWSFLRAIAHRVWLNELRFWHADKRDVEITSLDALEQEPVATGPSPTRARGPSLPEQEVLERESTRKLEALIAELGQEDQRYVRLWLDEHKTSEIAAAMRASIDAVKTRLKRIRKRLREKLADDYSASCFPRIEGDERGE